VRQKALNVTGFIQKKQAQSTMDSEDSSKVGTAAGSLAIRMLAMQEAFADPFADSGHPKELDPKGVSATAEWRKARRALFQQQPKLGGGLFSRRAAAAAGKENSAVVNPALNAKEKDGGYDPDKVFRTNPGFDPVFMKI